MNDSYYSKYLKYKNKYINYKLYNKNGGFIEGKAGSIVVSTPCLPFNYYYITENKLHLLHKLTENELMIEQELIKKQTINSTIVSKIFQNQQIFINEYTKYYILTSNYPNIFTTEKYILPINGGNVNLEIMENIIKKNSLWSYNNRNENFYNDLINKFDKNSITLHIRFNKGIQPYDYNCIELLKSNFTPKPVVESPWSKLLSN